jgi:tetratricopeptide (TPR) repeat protein
LLLGLVLSLGSTGWGQSPAAGRSGEGRIAELRGLGDLDADDGRRRELGTLLGASGRYAEAYPLLKSWFETHPEDFAIGLAAAFCADQLQRLAEVASFLDLIPEGPAQRQLLVGRLHLQRQETLQAIEILEEVLPRTSGPLKADVQRSLAEAYVEAGRSAGAAGLLIDLQPNLSTALQLSRAQYKAGDSEAASRSLEPYTTEILAAADRELSARAAVHLGRLRVLSGEYDGAVQLLELASRLDGSDLESLRLLGLALSGRGRYEEAREAQRRFRELYALTPQNSVLDDRIQEGYDDPTRKILREAMDALERGDLATAEALIEREAEVVANDPRLAAARSRLALERGDRAAAVEHLDRALNLSGADVPSELSGAAEALERGDIPEAKILLDRLLP